MRAGTCLGADRDGEAGVGETEFAEARREADPEEVADVGVAVALYGGK